MSRTRRGSKPAGFEYWGKRGWESKTLTHRIERAAKKRIILTEPKG